MADSSIDTITERLTVLYASLSLEASADLYSFVDVLKSFAALSFSSVVNQATLADTDAATTITYVLLRLISSLSQESKKSLSGEALELVECGMIGITSLFAGNNTVSNQRCLHRCCDAGTANVVIELLKVIALQVKNTPTQGSLPPIQSRATVEPEERDIPVQKLLGATENALILLENLALYASIREQIGQSSGCEVVVQVLTDLAPLLPAIAEHGVTVLSNLCCAVGSIDNVSADTNIQRIVRSGGCEVALSVLSKYAADVCVSDAALYLVQSLAAHDAEALSRFEKYYSAPIRVDKAKTNLKNTMSLYSLSSNTAESAVKQSKSFTFGSPQKTSKSAESVDPELHGVVALLLRVLHIHCTNSITIAEAAISALGSLVLQSPRLLLHLLANSGVEALLLVLESWGAASAAITAKCFKILTEMVEMTRRCRAELARVNSYFDSPGKSKPASSPAQQLGIASALGSPAVYSPATSSAVVHHKAPEAGSALSDPEDGGLFDCDDEPDADLTIDIGIPGITSAQLFKLLDRVTIRLILMDAENGTLEKELSKHAGAVAKKRVAMAAVGNIAIIASKMKSFKGNKSSGKSDKPAVISSAAPSNATSANNDASPSIASLVLPKISICSDTGGNSGDTRSLLAQDKSMLTLTQALHKVTEQQRGSTVESSALVAVETAGSEAADHALEEPTEAERVYQPVYVWVLRLLDRHCTSLEVLHPALRLLLVMCNYNVYPYHWNQVAATGHGTGCAVLANAFRNPELRASSDNTNEINAQGINIVYTSEMVVQTLHLMARAGEEGREKLSQAGAHGTVVDLLHAHGEHSLVLSTTGAAVFVLLYDNISSREANEGNATACTVVVKLLQQYLENVRFAEIAFSALQVLAVYTPNRRFLSAHKGCATIVSLLRHYTLQPGGPRNLPIALHGLATLAHLAGLEENESRIAKSGGCKLVVELLKEYGLSHETAAAEGLSAVSVLAMHNRGMLGEVGACTIVYDVLLHYNPSSEALNENIAHLAAMACFNLCLDYTENKQRFLQLNIANKFKDILNIRELSYAARGVVKDAINVVRF